MDKKDIKKLQRQFNRANNPPPPPLEVAFDCTKNGDHFNPLYHPRTYPRAWLSCHISDDCMRNILHSVLEQENLLDISNEELCKWMINQGIVDEVSASVYVLNYIANKKGEE